MPSLSHTVTSPVEISRPLRRTVAVATRSFPRPAERKLIEKPIVVPREPGVIPAFAQKHAVAAAEADLTDARNLSADYSKNYFYWACLHAARDDTDAALNDLETAVDKGFKWADWIESETSLEPLRASPRYDAALRKASKQ